MRSRLLIGCAVLFALGCGKKFAPVSGTVTMDNKALAGATVTFTPIAAKGSTEAGHSSLAKTNAEGKFTLQSTNGQTGALVGNHKVSISLISEDVGARDTRHGPRGGLQLGEKVPARYNTKSELTFDVPRGGSDKANFALKSAP
jgi:hypothetical protein